MFGGLTRFSADGDVLGFGAMSDAGNSRGIGRSIGAVPAGFFLLALLFLLTDSLMRYLSFVVGSASRAETCVDNAQNGSQRGFAFAEKADSQPTDFVDRKSVIHYAQAVGWKLGIGFRYLSAEVISRILGLDHAL